MRRGAAGLQKCRQCEAADADEAGLQHAATAGDDEALASAGVETAEGVAMSVGMTMIVPHGSTREAGRVK